MCAKWISYAAMTYQVHLYHEVQQGLLHVYLLNMTFLGSGCPSG